MSELIFGVREIHYTLERLVQLMSGITEAKVGPSGLIVSKEDYSFTRANGVSLHHFGFSIRWVNGRW